ncbi:hypothetical protein IMSAGC006_02144 [Muribaculaceae bacterium]|nr:hypothetical protein IMSAGC006_02144 [Muribaculaceae bacterium]
MFLRPAADHSSTYSAIVDEGVMGYMAATSENIYAMWAAAWLPSQVKNFFSLLIGMGWVMD